MTHDQLLRQIVEYDTLTKERRNQLHKAVDQLQKSLSVAEAQSLFDAAFMRASLEDRWCDAAGRLQTALLYRLGSLRRAVRLDVAFSNVTRLNARVKGAMLQYLARLAKRDSIRTLVSLFQSGSLGKVELSSEALAPLERGRYARLLWPGALHAFRDDGMCYAAMRLAWSHLKSGCFPRAAKLATTELFIEKLQATTQGITSFTAVSGPERYSDEHFEKHIMHGALAADALGYLRFDSSIASLQDAARNSDPYVAAYALASLRRLKVDVETALYDRVAVEPFARKELLDQLGKLGRNEFSRIPDRYTTLESIAEAVMAAWLAHPCESGHPPARIELMKLFTVPEIHRSRRIIALFRFKETASDSWKAGTAGPFNPKSRKLEQSHICTFSNFADWDERPPDEHLSDILEVIGAVVERHVSRKA